VVEQAGGKRGSSGLEGPGSHSLNKRRQKGAGRDKKKRKRQGKNVNMTRKGLIMTAKKRFLGKGSFNALGGGKEKRGRRRFHSSYRGLAASAGRLKTISAKGAKRFWRKRGKGGGVGGEKNTRKGEKETPMRRYIDKFFHHTGGQRSHFEEAGKKAQNSEEYKKMGHNVKKKKTLFNPLEESRICKSARRRMKLLWKVQRKEFSVERGAAKHQKAISLDGRKGNFRDPEWERKEMGQVICRENVCEGGREGRVSISP